MIPVIVGGIIAYTQRDKIKSWWNTRGWKEPPGVGLAYAPAARDEDAHTCPGMVQGQQDPGGKIVASHTKVKVDGKKIAVMTDVCTCPVSGNMIVEGSKETRLGGLPAARKGDRTAHKGFIAEGSPSLKFGGGTIDMETAVKEKLEREKKWGAQGPDADGGVLKPDGKGGYENLSKILNDFSQQDTLNETGRDKDRCGAQSTAAALAIRGPGAVENASEAAQQKAIDQMVKFQKEIDNTPDGERRKALIQQRSFLGQAVTQFDDTKEMSKKNALTKNQLSRFSDDLMQTYGVEPKDYNDRGKATYFGMSHAQEKAMLADLGLVNPNAPVPLGSDSEGRHLNSGSTPDEAVQNLVKNIPPGGTATVQVDPDKQKGVYGPTTTAYGNQTNEMPHYLLVGKKPDGTIYVYDSGYAGGPGSGGGGGGKGTYLEGDAAIQALKKDTGYWNSGSGPKPTLPAVHHNQPPAAAPK